MTEEERFEEALEKMEKIAKRWSKEDIGTRGRVIIANTLILAQIKYRAAVNAVSSRLKKATKEIIRNFIWKGSKL